MFAVEDAIVDGHPFWSDLFLIIAVVVFIVSMVLAAAPASPTRSRWMNAHVFVALGLACTTFAWLLL